jgi:hypothetical protein
MKRKTAVIAALVLLGTGLVMAQNQTNQTNQTQEEQNFTQEELDTVIVATNTNYPDAFISSAPSEKLGIPVLLTEPGNLSESTAEVFQERDVDTAIIIGGEAVISQDAEQEIEQQVNETVRIWDETAGGTSADVASFFWPEGFSEATLIQAETTGNYEDGYRLMSAVSAEESEGPVMVSEPGEISPGLMNELQRQGVDQLTVYTADAGNLEQQLEDAGIDAEINEDSVDQLTQEIYSESDVGDRQMVVTSGNFTQGLAVNAYANAYPYVAGENLTQTADFIQESDVQNVTLTGDQEQSNQIAQELENRDISSETVTEESSVETAVTFLDMTAEEWIEIQQNELQDWIDSFESDAEIEESVESMLEDARNATDQTDSQEADRFLEDAENNLENGEVFQAHLNVFRALSEAQFELWNQTQQDDEATTNQTENQTEVIPGQDNETSDETENQTPNETGNETSEVGTSNLTLEVSGDEVTASGSYTAETTGFTRIETLTVNGDEIDFTFELESPQEAAGQAVTTYEFEDSAQVEQGNYSASAELIVDGETIEQTEREVQVES